MSFNNSALATETVLTFLRAKFPGTVTSLDPIMKSLALLQVGEIIEFVLLLSDSCITQVGKVKLSAAAAAAAAEGGGSSKDRERLDIIFSELKACKDDSQQRSWALYDDYAVIVEYLEELITLLVLRGEKSFIY